MTILTVNYSESLKQLYTQGFNGFDGLEVGRWNTPEEILQFREFFSEKPFYFHLGNVRFPKKMRESIFGEVKHYLSVTESPWLSCHTELLTRHTFYLGQNKGIFLPPPKPEKSIQHYLRILESLKEVANVPFLLENMHSLPGKRYEFAANPEILASLMQQTDSYFLLDLAHARVAAGFQNQEIHSYIERFPLSRVKQIHVSGARVEKGRLYDAHESLQEEEYRLLEWLLTICKPEVVTLEYIKQKAPLHEMLLTLKSLVAAH